ncbi:general secretion pathway protein GspH [Geotalea uraniireducens]|uniref:Type II secretion system protein H n=2 Tax=Geotalea uraniireducens TaxID=351604 RepID=A0ABM8ER36_9BACT|nr:general secretion pathway protein GspH [Geotalea uraniireducens]
MELVVVIALLSLVTIMVVPRLSVSKAAELARAARELAATIRYLQDQAITTKSAYRLHLETGGSTITVRTVLADGSEGTPGEPILSQPLLTDGMSVADVFSQRAGKLADGEAMIDFGPGGIQDFTAIHLKDSAEEFYTIMIYPSSGKVTVTKGYQEAPQ